jgi:hypothetical protein
MNSCKILVYVVSYALLTTTVTATNVTGTVCDSFCEDPSACGWTEAWSCPWAPEPGTNGRAGDDGSEGYDCCCKYTTAEDQKCGANAPVTPPAGESAGTCWIGSYGRGVGVLREARCPPGYRYDGISTCGCQEGCFLGICCGCNPGRDYQTGGKCCGSVCTGCTTAPVWDSSSCPYNTFNCPEGYARDSASSPELCYVPCGDG